MNFSWDDTNTEKAKRLWLNGHSASLIAREIGAPSRNAVIGKAHRGGWPRSAEVSRQNAARGSRRTPAAVQRERDEQVRKARREARPKPAAKPSRRRAALDEIVCAPRPWLTRQAKECCWPVHFAGADTQSCCNRTDGEGPYCEDHAGVAYRSAPPRPALAQRESTFERWAA